MGERSENKNTAGDTMAIKSNLDQYAENETGEQFTKQNSKLLKIELSAGGVQAKRGSMVAYQGEVSFENKGSGGLGKMLKKAATGEGADMMTASGSGELFIADDAKDVHIMYLENDTCLLYTSPSPRDQRGSRMPSSA